MLWVDEGTELLLAELKVLVPVRHCPPPSVSQLELPELSECLRVHIVLHDPAPVLVGDVLVSQEAILDGAVFIPTELRLLLWV